MSKHIEYQIKVSATLQEKNLKHPYFIQQFNYNSGVSTAREISKTPSNSPPKIGPIIKVDLSFEDLLLEKRLALEIPPGLFECDINRLGTNFINKNKSHKRNSKEINNNFQNTSELDDSQLYEEQFLSDGFDSAKE